MEDKKKDNSSLVEILSGQEAYDKVWLRISAFISLKTANTKRTYAAVIREWCEFLGVVPGTRKASAAICSATDIQAAAYIRWLQKKPGMIPRDHQDEVSTELVVAPDNIEETKGVRDGVQVGSASATIVKKMAILRRIYKLLITAGEKTGINPFDTDILPAVKRSSGMKRPTEMIPFDQVMKIVNMPDITTEKGLRDKAILALLFGCGLRRSEVVRLRLSDIKRSPQGTVYIRLRATKSGEDFDQAMPPWVTKAVLDFADLRFQKHKAGLSDYLFIGYKGKGQKPAGKSLTDNGLYKIFKWYCKKAGVGSHVTPHSARATAITKLLADGIPHREVQEFSRHKSIQMVELYDKRRLGVEKNPARKLKY